MPTLLDAPDIGRRPRAAHGASPAMYAPRSGAEHAARSAAENSGPQGRVPTMARLERALHVLLTPLDAPDFAAWRTALHAALLELFEADSMSLYLPVRVEGDADASPSALDDLYAPHAGPDAAVALLGELLPGADDESALRTTAEHAIPPQGGLVRRDRLRDATFVRVPFGGASDARLWIVGGAGAEPAADRVSLVRTVVPALRAGLAAWAQVGQQRAALGRLLDTGAGCALAFDGRGRTVHESAACARLLADETGGDAARVRDAARTLALGAVHARDAQDAGRAADATLVVRTARHRYELCAARATALFGREPTVVVSLRRHEPAALDDAALRERYGLTPREIEVARLLAEGLSNDELAGRMGVSFFTARNHVERLLRKLGASNRARVGAMLRD